MGEFESRLGFKSRFERFLGNDSTNFRIHSAWEIEIWFDSVFFCDSIRSVGFDSRIL